MPPQGWLLASFIFFPSYMVFNGGLQKIGRLRQRRTEIAYGEGENIRSLRTGLFTFKGCCCGGCPARYLAETISAAKEIS